MNNLRLSKRPLTAVENNQYVMFQSCCRL